jgi:hypothetical protein
VISFPIFEQFDAVNPCTGLDMTITVTGTAWWHAHNNNDVLRYKRTITTSDGFEGRGHATEVGNYAGASLYRFTFNDMMTHPSGAKFKAHQVLVGDFGTPTVHVDKFAATCLGP